MDETTRIDAAPTPAPVFAYRAFRSLFVQTPMHSPVVKAEAYRSTQPKECEQQASTHDGKREISRTRSSRFTSSPTQTKRKDYDAQVLGSVFDSADVHLTPKRQKQQPVSPSKSILKARNTPRRDPTITVAFKSASKSPEVVRKLPFLLKRPHKDDRRHNPVLQTTKPVLEPVPLGLSQSPNMDWTAYKAQTEKEMKRLLKYASKWKDEARKSANEVKELQTKVDKLQVENQQLAAKLQDARERHDQERQQKQKQQREANEQRRLESTSLQPQLSSERAEFRPRSQRRPTQLEQRVEQVLMNEALDIPSKSIRRAASLQHVTKGLDLESEGSLRQQNALLPRKATSRLMKQPEGQIPIEIDSLPSLPRIDHDIVQTKPRVTSLPAISVKQRVQDRRAAIRAKLQAGVKEQPPDAVKTTSQRHAISDAIESESGLDWADL